MAISQSTSAAEETPRGAKGIKKEEYSQLPLLRLNFILMVVAGAMIIIGFLLMLGGSSTVDSFNPDIFSTRRIVIGPMITFLGFIAMGVAVIWPPKAKKN